jgi:hypothetical protein
MPYTPQYNGFVEHRIALMCSCAHSQCLPARFNEDYIQLIWAEAVNKANTNGNVACINLTKVCSNKLLKGKKPHIIPYLIQFGRIMVVAIRHKFCGKWKE